MPDRARPVCGPAEPYAAAEPPGQDLRHKYRIVISAPSPYAEQAISPRTRALIGELASGQGQYPKSGVRTPPDRDPRFQACQLSALLLSTWRSKFIPQYHAAAGCNFLSPLYVEAELPQNMSRHSIAFVHIRQKAAQLQPSKCQIDKRRGSFGSKSSSPIRPRKVAGKMRGVCLAGGPQAAAPDIFLLVLQNRGPQAMHPRRFSKILAPESRACLLRRPCLTAHIPVDFRVSVH